MQSGKGLYLIFNTKTRNFATLPDANAGTDLRGGYQSSDDHPEYVWEIVQHPNGSYDIKNNLFGCYATWHEDTGPMQTVCGEDKTRITWRITPKDSYEYSISVSDKALFWSLDSGDSPVSLSSDDNDKSSWKIVPMSGSQPASASSSDPTFVPRIPDIPPLLNSLHYGTQILGANYLRDFAASDAKGATAMPNLLSALFRLLEAPDPNVISSAAEAVDAVAVHMRERVDSLENKAIPSLIHLLSSYKDVEVQITAANALRKIVSHRLKPQVEQTAVPVLVSLLNAGPVEVQTAACDALRNVSWDSNTHMGVLQKSQVAKALQSCLNSKDPDLQMSAHATLQCINVDDETIRSPSISSIKSEPDKLLQVRIVPYDVKIYDNDGTFLTATFFSYKPNLREGWYYLGPSANGAGTQSLSYGPVVRELREGTLADVVDWECVWTNAKTTDKLKYSIWRGIPPTPEYVVVGNFFVRNWKKPTKHDVRGIKAVRRSVLVEAEAGRAAWDNSNYWFGQPASAWDVHEYGNAINPGVFIHNNKHSAPREGIYAIDSARVQVVE